MKTYVSYIFIYLTLHSLGSQEDDRFEYERMDDLLESIKLLANDSTRYRAKADRASQRTAFRDIISSIETREPPCIPMTIRNQSVDFDSWAKVKQWSALKLIAGEGLDVHASENVRIAGLFDLSMGDFGAKGSMNLRYHDTTVGKSRAKEKRQDRGRRAADNAFEGEDFE
jgi:hypothetical protein